MSKLVKLGSTVGALAQGRGKSVGFSGGSLATPGFDISSAVGPGGRFGTSLTRTGTPAQTEFDERFSRGLTDLDQLRGQLTPGFSQLRTARLAEIDAARQRSIGTLRENLSRRRLQGSSFANDALTRAEKEFGLAASRTVGETFLQEIAATQEVLRQEAQITAAGIQREFSEAGLASQFGLEMARIVSGGAQADQNRRSANAAQRDAIFGTIAGEDDFFGLDVIGDKLGGGEGTGGLSSLFGTSGLFGSGAGAATGGTSAAGILSSAALFTSSKTLKRNGRPVFSVLPRIAMLDIEAWDYLSDVDDGGTHIGPYAEDFHALFGVGNDKTIHMADATGITLLAIQELNIRVEALENA